MDIRAFLSHIVQLDIRIRKAINTQMHGNFSSVFKGSGLEFSDLRQYQYGDDVRHIDWNSTAKGHGTFIKLFKEEKEQTVFFLLDVSSSQNISNGDESKLQTLKEVAGVLTFSAMQEAGNIGLCCYSDKNEKFIAPGAGKKHGYQVINELFKLIPENAGTDLKQALKDFVATSNSGVYQDEEQLFSKFPEFGIVVEGPTEVSIIPVTVTAAASVPSSSIFR